MTGTAGQAGVLPRALMAGAAARPWAVAIALALPLAAFWFTGHHGLNLQDESFLWYGAQRVLAGELPLRDFQSYDVGRYFWSAGWMWLFDNDGIVAMRAGNAVLASITVAMAAVLMSMQPAPAWRILLAVPAFAVWMVPDFKVADSFAVMLMVAGLAAALARVGVRSCAWLGICLGVVSAIGINHALYGSIAVALALGLRYRQVRLLPSGRMLVAFVTGGVVGYSPVIACHLFASGFTAAFIDSIRMLFEAGTTNLPLPLPRLHAWFAPSGQDAASALRESLTALAGLAGGGFLALAMRRVWKDWRPSNIGAAAGNAAGNTTGDAAAGSAGGAVFAAAVLVSIPYAHYTVSRFDVFHVALSILPILVAAWTWPGRQRTGWGDVVLVAAVVAGTVLSLFEQRAYPMLRGWTAERVQVLGDTLYVEPHAADVLSLLRAQVDTHARDGRSFLAAPYWPGAYAVERRRAPVWEIYQLFPATDARQRREIARLREADIGFSMFSLFRADARPDLGFQSTHPLIVAYIDRCMKLLPPSPSTEGRDIRIHVAGDPGCTIE
ncbi:MAG: hypothetical protein ACK5V7_17395 [bacterium]